MREVNIKLDGQTFSVPEEDAEQLLKFCQIRYGTDFCDQHIKIIKYPSISRRDLFGNIQKIHTNYLNRISKLLEQPLNHDVSGLIIDKTSAVNSEHPILKLNGLRYIAEAKKVQNNIISLDYSDLETGYIYDLRTKEQEFKPITSKITKLNEGSPVEILKIYDEFVLDTKGILYYVTSRRRKNVTIKVLNADGPKFIDFNVDYFLADNGQLYTYNGKLPFKLVSDYSDIIQFEYYENDLIVLTSSGQLLGDLELNIDIVSEVYPEKVIYFDVDHDNDNSIALLSDRGHVYYLENETLSKIDLDFIAKYVITYYKILYILSEEHRVYKYDVASTALTEIEAMKGVLTINKSVDFIYGFIDPELIIIKIRRDIDFLDLKNPK